MAVVNGHSGLVTSWGSPNNQIISTSVTPFRYTLNQTAESFDSTIMAASLTTGLNLKGLRSWSVTMEGHRPTAAIGSAASITFSPGYVANVRSWEIVFTADEYDNTAMGSAATSAGWRTFAGGIWRVSGQYEAFLDDTTPLTAPGNGSEPATMTLDIGGTKTFAFSAQTQGGPVDVAIGQPQVVRYSFNNAGAVTVTDSGNTLPMPNTGLAIPTASSLVLQSTSTNTQTFTGSAFPRVIRMRCPVDGPIITTIEARGTGAITYG